jgi:quinol monooxygenase YgiN
MESRNVRLNVDLTILEGKLGAFQETARQMIAGSKKEPGTLTYDFYFSSDQKRCRLIEIYADAAAAETHLMGPVVQQLVPKLLESSSISRFEVYGDPSPKLAETVTGLGAEIFPFWQGLGH